jgi:thiol:disulfide interchange protein DsbC
MKSKISLIIRKCSHLFLVTALVLVAYGSATAQPSASPAASAASSPVKSELGLSPADELMARLKSVEVWGLAKKKFPNTRIGAIELTPIPGIYSLEFGKYVVYVNADLRYFIMGRLLDSDQSFKDLTEPKQQAMDRWLVRKQIEELPTKDAITYKIGTGARKLYVFADPECGYCKQLEQTLASASNLTVHVFLLPVLGPKSHQNATTIWCSKNQSGAWLDKMLRNQMPGKTSPCETPLERNLVLAKKLGIQGTPYLLFENGKSMAGTLSSAQLNDFLKPIDGE